MQPMCVTGCIRSRFDDIMIHVAWIGKSAWSATCCTQSPPSAQHGARLAASLQKSFLSGKMEWLSFIKTTKPMMIWWVPVPVMDTGSFRRPAPDTCVALINAYRTSCAVFLPTSVSELVRDDDMDKVGMRHTCSRRNQDSRLGSTRKCEKDQVPDQMMTWTWEKDKKTATIFKDIFLHGGSQVNQWHSWKRGP
jgi:hypothetical protein